MQVLMCPPDTCLATGGGCDGSRIIDKQPVVCGVDTVNADVGTTYTLRYAVYNSAGMKATVERIISVVSPCDSGQFLCGTTCSGVSQGGPFLGCALSSLHLSQRALALPWFSKSVLRTPSWPTPTRHALISPLPGPFSRWTVL